jgi:hypothetical protein
MSRGGAWVINARYVMKRIIVIVLSIIISGGFAAGCKKNVRETPLAERQDAIYVTWEFTSADRDGEPYTEASLIINGSREHRHRIGVYYGRVRRILSPGEINREMLGGTLSGFITNGGGRGHEVIVRYNEQLQRLIVAERQWSEKLPAGSYAVVKSIPVPEMKKEKIGF